MGQDIALQDADRWSIAYGHVVQARRQLLDQPPNPLADSCFANAVLLDAANVFELLGVTPTAVPPQHSPQFCVEAALALLKDATEVDEAHRVRKILMPFRSENWED